MNFVSTSAFRESLNKLTKREDSGYKSSNTDICNELKAASFDDIFNRHFLIKQSGEIRLIKLRLQNSDQNLSSAAGYRLIIICNPKHDHVALLEIYPKKGKYSKTDLTKHEYKDIVNCYGDELRKNELITHDIQNSLAIIVPKKNK